MNEDTIESLRIERDNYYTEFTGALQKLDNLEVLLEALAPVSAECDELKQKLAVAEDTLKDLFKAWDDLGEYKDDDFGHMYLAIEKARLKGGKSE